MASGKIKDCESFEEYRIRLKNEGFEIKQKMSFKLFYDSSKMPPYKKPRPFKLLRWES